MNNSTSNQSFIAPRLLGLMTVLLSFFLAATTSSAKRAAPQPVPAVTLKNIEYSAPHDLMGFVVATDTTSHKELWRERIYAVTVNPALENDVQHVFITSLVIEGSTLVITNERGESYALDLATRKVTKRE